jgi:head-tail adaptor
MLTAADLATMRDDIAQLLPDTCDILYAISTGDGQGNETVTWGTATANVACRVDNYRRGDERVIAKALQPFQQATISLPYSTVITPANRIQVGAYVFTVQSVNISQSWKAVTRVDAELIP